MLYVQVAVEQCNHSYNGTNVKPAYRWPPQFRPYEVV